MIQKFRVPPKRSLTYRRRGVSGVKTFLGTGKNHCVDEKLFLSNHSLSSSSQEESSSSLLQFPAAWLAAPRVCRPSVVSFSFAFDHVLRLEPSPLLSLRLYSFLRVNSPPNRLLTPSLIPRDAIQPILAKWEKEEREWKNDFSKEKKEIFNFNYSFRIIIKLYEGMFLLIIS